MIAGRPTGENPWAAPSLPVHPNASTFTLGSLMLVIALIAVCLGVTVEVPGLGILLIVLAAPALVRTLLNVSHSKAEGVTLTLPQKAALFLGSLGIVALIALGALIAFVITCVPAGFVGIETDGNVGIVLAIGAGLIAAGAAGFFLARRLWPRRV